MKPLNNPAHSAPMSLDVPLLVGEEAAHWARSGDGDLWVFAYGSLIWRPEGPVAEQVLGRLSGWRRALCIWSVYYRGTPEEPGLVLGLDADPDAACAGVVFRIAAADRRVVAEALDRRELPTRCYHPRVVPVRLSDGRQVAAYTYTADRHHAQYACGVGEDEQVRRVAVSVGQSGRCYDYLASTVEHLRRWGVADAALEDIVQKAGQWEDGERFL